MPSLKLSFHVLEDKGLYRWGKRNRQALFSRSNLTLYRITAVFSYFLNIFEWYVLEYDLCSNCAGRNSIISSNLIKGMDVNVLLSLAFIFTRTSCKGQQF